MKKKKGEKKTAYVFAVLLFLPFLHIVAMLDDSMVGVATSLKGWVSEFCGGGGGFDYTHPISSSSVLWAIFTFFFSFREMDEGARLLLLGGRAGLARLVVQVLGAMLWSSGKCYQLIMHSSHAIQPKHMQCIT